MTTRHRLKLADECDLKWCNEAGDHLVHRQYVTSLLNRQGCMVGVNVMQAAEAPSAVEVTLIPRRAASRVLALVPSEARAVVRALNAAIRLADRL